MEPVFLLQRFVVLFFELKNFPYVYAASSVLWMASSSWKMETREVWEIHRKRANYVVLRSNGTHWRCTLRPFFYLHRGRNTVITVAAHRQTSCIIPISSTKGVAKVVFPCSIEHSPGKVKIIQDFITFIQLSICFATIFIIMTIELVLLDFWTFKNQ